MTEITATTEHTIPQPSIGTLEHLDPHTLQIGDNMRDDAALDKGFVDSIAQHGVILHGPA
ncbi:MAG TPA: hypothetical protein VEF72_23245 [Mycobacterium sp.]|nr:hypothetical protein [Mycobacterium sp.]